jgi:hypothetical protein
VREDHRSQTRRLWFAWGLAAAICYLVVGTQVWPSNPLRLLYEGEAPPLPYRWVRPPANLPEPNQPPASGVGEIALTPTGSQSASVLTDDGQAALILRFGAIAPRAGASTVTVRITPLDPRSAAPPPNLVIDGNAYRMEATYNTGEPVTLVKPVTPVLRYPKHATVLLRSSGSGWVAVESHVVAGSLQLFGPSDMLGVFAAAAPRGTSPLPWPRYAVSLAVAGVLVALAAMVRARRRRDRRGRARR